MSGGFLDVLGPAAPAWRQKMVRRRYGKNEPIFHEGELGDTFHVIDKGRVLIEVSTASGDVAALGVRGPGEVLGELAIVGAGRCAAKITALEPTETLALTRATLDEMRRADPSVDQRLLQILAARLQETMDQLMEVLFISMETRVISMETRVLRVLLRLAEAFDSNTTPIIVRVRQDDIAAMAGTRRQTANRPLKAAEAEGAI